MKRQYNRLSKELYTGGFWYFVTICVDDMKCIFVESATPPTYIEDVYKFKLNNIGNIVESTWLDIPKYYSNITLDRYVLMPNHFHGIIGIDKNSYSLATSKKVSLGDIISSFKQISLRNVKKYNNHNVGEVADSTENIMNKYNTFWQKSFYDHIIRNDTDLLRIKEYIINNPINWELDTLNPTNFNK